jgi:hypothetical protein
MLAELVDFLVWLMRAALIAGLAWGAWLSFGLALPARDTARGLRFERLATLGLLVLLLTTIGSLLHAG